MEHDEKLKETRVFINPDLLQSEAGFDALKDYFSTTTPADCTMIYGIVDGELLTEDILTSSTHSICTNRIMCDYYAMTNGYFKMSVFAIRNFLGL